MVSSPRSRVVAIVAGLCALGGAVAGGIAALIASVVLTPADPMGASGIALMALEYGLVAGAGGAALGTVIAFGALRRVPLGRLLVCTNAGLAAGLTAGWIGGPWAWHHMGLLGAIGFSAGALFARVYSRGSRVPSTSIPLQSTQTGGAIASGAQGGIGSGSQSGELDAPAERSADRIGRR